MRLKEFRTLYESYRYINLLFLKPVQLHNGRANGIIKKGKKYTLAFQSRVAAGDDKERYYSPYTGSMIQRVKVSDRKTLGLSRDSIRLNDDIIEAMIQKGIVKDLS
jgi:hypothetical protein